MNNRILGFLLVVTTTIYFAALAVATDINQDIESDGPARNYLNYINETEAKNLTPEEIEYITLNEGKRPPKRFSDWISLVHEKKCPKSINFYSQIFEDLLPFYELKNGKTVSKITNEMLENSYSTGWIIHIQIINSIIQNPDYIPYGMGGYFNNVLHLLPNNFYIPISRMDEDLCLPSDDGSSKPYTDNNECMERNKCFRETYNNNQTKIVPGTIAHSHGAFIEPLSFTTLPDLFPILSFSKRSCFKDLLYGSPISLNYYNDEFEWKAKKDKMTWRGSNSGTKIYPNSLHELSHRFRLVDWGLKFKDSVKKNLGIDVDIAFHDLVNCENETLCQEAKKTTLVLPFISSKEIFESKYMVYVDGNSWAFRLATYLASNSVVFYNGFYKFWYSKHLKPYVHYVPYKADFSDFYQQLEYAKNHDEEMKKINENAKKFVKEFINDEALSCYLGLLLIEYADLVKHLY